MAILVKLANFTDHSRETLYQGFQGVYTLSIIDNGLGVYPLKEGWGTKQFKNLAQQINGKFRRVSLHPQGTLCELSWPLPNSFWWQ